MLSGWRHVLLGSRSVLRLAGEDVCKLLQGLTTRNVMDIGQSGTPVYAAMLNSKGRQLFDMLLYREACDQNAVLLDCPAESRTKLLSLLMKFKLRSAVTIDDASKEFQILAAWGAPAVTNESQDSKSLADLLPVDPRLAQLGLRGPLPCASCQKANTNETEYREHRFMHGVPEGPAEIPSGSAIPLEYNIDWLNGVSYDKGCYVGQELVARVHFGGLVRKRLYPVRLDPPLEHGNLEDTPVFVGEKASSIGSLRGAQGLYGIAHLRISDVEATFTKGLQLHAQVHGVGVSLTPSIPDWWPKR